MLVEAVLLTIITAATPLLYAAIGELITERSGVLNLGVEGMMAMGAVSGFAVAYLTGVPALGVLGAIIGGTLTSVVFAVVTLLLRANQVASGLALTLFGLGLSALIGNAYVGRPGAAIPKFGGIDALIPLAVLLTIAVSWFLFRTRAGLILRAIGDNHGSAHALGYKVVRVRFLAVMFGGACAGLGGGYLSLVYTPQWAQNMTAGRGWIALALVVFGSWLPGRVAAGAVLFGMVSILQLHVQASGLVAIPSQFLSMLPYLMTIVVLVLISRNRAVQRTNTPACLGQSFVPDR